MPGKGYKAATGTVTCFPSAAARSCAIGECAAECGEQHAQEGEEVRQPFRDARWPHVQNAAGLKIRLRNRRDNLRIALRPSRGTFSARD